MTTPAAALEHRADQRRIARTAAQRAAQAWAQVDPGNIKGSWAEQLPKVFGVVAGAQLTAARLADPYLEDVAGTAAPAQGLVVAQSLAGVASDGRDLASLLAWPMITAMRALAGGQLVGGALASGLAVLDMIVRTQVSDAARVADLVATTARPKLEAYVRVVELPACARCIVLAGQVYRWSTGFERHPNCNCAMYPVSSREAAAAVDPRALFDSMSPEEQLRRFGAAGVEAILAGADLAQVVNARRGMSTASIGGRRVRVTREGITRRGIAGARLITGDPNAFTAPRGDAGTTVVSEFVRQGRLGQQRVRLRGAAAPRLMPEQILASAESRDQALQLLRLHGYIIDRPKRRVSVPEPLPAAPEPESAPVAAVEIPEPRLSDVEVPDEVEAPVDVPDVTGWSDEELELGVAEHAEDAVLLDAILAELDRRQADEPETVDDEPGDDPDAERWARVDELAAEGLSYEQAYAEVFGKDVDRMRREDAITRLRRAGYVGRGFDELARAAFRDALDEQYLAAEAATNGFLLTAQGQRNGLDPRDLWLRNESYARKWASDELKEWWDANGRVTFDEFSAGLLTGEAAQRFRTGGESWLR